MNKIIIGCDPDSSKSGIALYQDGKLVDLSCLDLGCIYRNFENISDSKIEAELHIENVCGTSAAFTAKQAKSQAAKLKIAQNIGQVKQAQIEIERIAEHFGIKVVRHPISSKWKKGASKKEFDRLTGWTGKSNEDSRSAAYFGYIGVLKNEKTNKHTP